MTTRKRFLLFGGALSSFVLLTLTACNTQPQSIDAAVDGDQDRYHEKSFSWDDGSSAKTLAKAAALETRFNSTEELQQAVKMLDTELQVPGASDSLWKPIDYACDELALGLWQKYGTISIGDSVVLNESVLKESCRYIGENPIRLEQGDLHKSSATTEAIDRKYPYKMIGTGWSGSILGYTGAETQFKKERRIWGVKGWYDLDATRIGVRSHFLNCTYGGARKCVTGKVLHDWDSNDPYVSERVFMAAEQPYLTTIPTGNSYPATEQVYLVNNTAIIGMHSVDHAGLQFRAQSIAGLGSNGTIVGTIDPYYVTW